MRIAIDAMGGDHAPLAPVSAVEQLAGSHPETEFVIVGDEKAIQEHHVSAFQKNVSVVHAETVIKSDDEPVKAVRRKKDSSLVQCAQLVKDGLANVMISAGNTGALVAAGLLVIGRLEGIDRPALSPVLPTFLGNGVLLLDAGATMDAKPENLLQFAYMGSIYSRYVLGVKEPRVGLLNVGTEEAKGNTLCKETFPLLQKADLTFIGNLEARDLLSGECDVVVCDGFVGNVALKLVEGMGLGVFGEMKDMFMENFKTKLAAAVLKPSLRRFRKRFDYAEYGGAPFLGVAGGCIKAHGSSGTRAWVRALEQAILFEKQQILTKIQSEILRER